MKFNKLTVNLMVEDVARTLDFYLDVLGFEFVMGVAQGSRQAVTAYTRTVTLDFGIVRRGGVEIMFQRRGSLAEDIPAFAGMAVGGSFGCYIEMAGVDRYHAAVRDKVELVSGLETRFYGMREFTIRDCNGYFFTFAERV